MNGWEYVLPAAAIYGLLLLRRWWLGRYRRAADRLRDSPPGIWPYGGP